MKTNFKYDRIAEDIKILVTRVLNDEVGGCEFLSVTHVEITKDLGDAKIYYQSLDSKESEQVKENLRIATPYLKKQIAKNIKIRKIPNLIFKYDSSLENYNKIENLLK